MKCRDDSWHESEDGEFGKTVSVSKAHTSADARGSSGFLNPEEPVSALRQIKHASWCSSLIMQQTQPVRPHEATKF